MTAKSHSDPPPFEEVVRRMLNTPPAPRQPKPKKKTAKKPAK
jgi:hypothetical protein